MSPYRFYGVHDDRSATQSIVLFLEFIHSAAFRVFGCYVVRSIEIRAQRRGHIKSVLGAILFEGGRVCVPLVVGR